VTGRIGWLASYPKSGNTWVRAFLTNYRRGAHDPADINELDGGVIASSRPLFDEESGAEASDLTRDEIAAARPAVYRALSDAAAGLMLVKVHDAFAEGPGGPLFPPDATACAIYVVRNPLDVAVSFARYMNVPVVEAIRRMNDGFALAAPGPSLSEQLEQRLRPWSEHVASWVDQRQIEVHVVRFEDLLQDPLETFAGVVVACGLPLDRKTVARAADFSSFERLAQQERARGFRERSAHGGVFFRQGQAGAWRRHLTAAEVAAIVGAHGPAMRRFGYLSAAGEPS
jgi:hypothetical protein